MTNQEAIRLLHPDTTAEAIAEIEYYGGFKGHEKTIRALNEASLLACEALEKQVPKIPDNVDDRYVENYNTLKDMVRYCAKNKKKTIFHVTELERRCGMSDKTSDKLLPCPFCGGKAKIYEVLNGVSVTCGDCGCGTLMFLNGDKKAQAIAAWNTRKPMERYEELEKQLQSVYGDCDGLVEKVIEALIKHNRDNGGFGNPRKARLLTDEDVDKWDRLKGAMERIVKRLEWLRKRNIELSEKTDWSSVYIHKADSYEMAIEVVKEEGAIG